MAVVLQIPLEEVITWHVGPPQPRAGEQSSRPWWVCPFHADRNPSLSVVPGTGRWKCFGCGVHGDAIDLVRKLRPGMTFKDAKAAIGCENLAASRTAPGPTVSPPPPRRPERPAGWQAFAQEVVEKAETNLW
jgi:hypothetical protein